MSPAGATRRRLRSRVVGRAAFYPIFVLFGLNAVDELDRSAFGVLLPEIRDHFRLDLQGILALQALVGVAVLGLAVPIAHFADRRGNRVKLAGVGASVWGFFSVLTGLATSVAVLGVARAGSGIGQSVNLPTHNSLISDYYGLDVRTKVYGMHRAANAVGLCLGPLSAGLLAYAFGWRTPFLVFALPTLAFVVLALRLREPRRGVFERLAAGAAADIATTEEIPPTYREASRTLWQVRSLRRIWFSLPFFGAAFFGLAALFSLYYDEEFGLSEVQRGLLFAAIQPGELVGLLLGIPLATRLAVRDPGLVLRMVAVVATVVAGGFVALALVPSLPIAIAVNLLIVAAGAILIPGLTAVLSLTIPPKVRSLGFSLGALWYLPGLIVLPIIGAVGDRHGIRWGILLIVPVYLVGALIVSTSGRFVAIDMKQVHLAAATQAEVRAARMRGDPTMLTVRSLEVSYGQTQVLFGVDFTVRDGEIVALLGTNGAGKSTLLKAVSGSVEPTSGVVLYDGRDVTFAPPSETAAWGMVIVPGGRGAFPSLTVAENIKLAGWLFARDPDHIEAATEQALDFFPVLRNRWDQRAGNLSGGEQQMLTLGQALIARPRLLMIDELSLGLSPVVVDQLLQAVRAIHEAGTTIVVVEQSVNIALSLAQRAVFLEKGEVRYDGPTAALLERPDILRSVFLAGTVEAATAPRPVPVRAVGRLPRDDGSGGDGAILEVERASISFGGIRAVDGVDVTLRGGEILGLIGPNGAGKTTLFDIISGFIAPDVGRVIFAGTDITRLSPDARARRGLGRSFQDARLFPPMTVAQTVAVALDRHLDTKDVVSAFVASPAIALSERWVAARVEELLELTGLMAYHNKFVSELSTGTRRIVDLTCTLAHQPTVLLLDEPSSGIAQREAEALAPLLRRVRDATGAGLLLIEHDMPLVNAVADTMVALDLGRVIARGSPRDVTEHPAVVASYLGTSIEAARRSGVTVDVAPDMSAPRLRRPRGPVGAADARQ